MTARKTIAIPEPTAGNTLSVLVALVNSVRYLLANGGSTASSSAATTSTASHNALNNIQGGDTLNRYHLTDAQATSLTGGSASTDHYHASDRDLGNATGSLLWGQLDTTAASLADLPVRNHSQLNNVSGSAEGFHLSSAQTTGLTGSGDTALHYHDSDRARANHTGTQTASTISDFNEAAQDAVGGIVTDSATIDFTYDDAGNTITASVKDNSINLAKLADIATASLMGRTTAGTGGPEVLSVATAKTLLNLAGNNSGDQTIELTGDVTGSGTGSFAATIAANAVTYAKLQNVSATDRLLGRSTAGAGDVEEIACTAAGRALLDDADAGAQLATLGTAAYSEGTWTPTFTGLTVVLGAGNVTYAGRWQRIGNLVKFTVTITPAGGATIAAVAGTTYCDMGVAATTSDACVSANLTTFIGLGTGAIDAATDRLYPPGWTAMTNTVVISGQYEA